MVLPESIFGYDTDEIFGYNTVKTAWIRDRWLGILYYLLVMLVGFYVVFVQILWRNEHFMLKDVRGVARIWFTHPTVDNCDPEEFTCKNDWMSMDHLSYCKQGTGPNKVERPARCAYRDKFGMLVNPVQNDHVFVPTASVTFTETLSCDIEDPECDHMYTRPPMPYYYDPEHITYFADIERFRFQLTSSYDRDGISGTSLEHQGHLEECVEEPKPAVPRGWAERIKRGPAGCTNRGGTVRTKIPCKAGAICEVKNKQMPGPLGDMEDGVQEAEGLVGFHQHGSPAAGPSQPVTVAGSRAAHLKPRMLNRHKVSYSADARGGAHGEAASFLESVSSAGAPRANGKAVEEQNEHDKDMERYMYMSPWGDSFRLSKLLSVAGVNMDYDLNVDGLTVRQAGTIVEVEAVYNNMYRMASTFGFSPVEYTYRVKELAVPYMSREYFDPVQPADYPKSRRIVLEHGVMIVFKVSGEFGFFNFVYLLIMLSVSGALIGGAMKVTDGVAMYVHPRRRNYFHLKYEVSPDFSDMWKCGKCGFYNEKHQTRCQGLDRWESKDDVELCGEPRGSSA